MDQQLTKISPPARPKRVAASSLPAPGLAELLRAELARRCHQNPGYSLRAFAKSLGLSAAFVSKLLKGQRRFTLAMVDHLGDRLGLDPAELAPLRAEAARKPGVEASAAIAGASYRQISLDQFQLISDWYHFAILELTTVAGFESNARWVARSLGINVHQATDALERLERMGYLARTAAGNLELVETNNTNAGLPASPAAARAQQTQFLELAATAVRELPAERRSQSGMTMAIPMARMPEAVAAITKFRRELTALMQRPGERDSVYQLSISFFPLTN